MQIKIGIRFHHAEITYFDINRLYAYIKQIQQADYKQRNSLLIKVKYKIDYLAKIAKLERKFLVSFRMYIIFLIAYDPSIAASEAWSLTRLLSTKMRGEGNSHKNINVPVFQIYLINKGVISPYVQ